MDVYIGEIEHSGRKGRVFGGVLNRIFGILRIRRIPDMTLTIIKIKTIVEIASGILLIL